MAYKQNQDLTERGVSQGDLVACLKNITALLNQLRQSVLYGALGNPSFAISTNFDVLNNAAIDYTNNGTLKTLAQYTNFDSGTTKTIAGSKWGAALLSVNASGAGVVTWATGAGYDTEAEALAALVLPNATHTPLGILAVQAHASGFTAGTDALQGGTGGNVSPDTNYYNSINPNTLMIGGTVSTQRN